MYEESEGLNDRASEVDIVTVNGVGNWGAPASNTKVVTKGTTAQSDYFLSYYDSNILYWVNGTNNNASKSLEDSDNGNSWAMNDPSDVTSYIYKHGVPPHCGK